MIGAAAPAAVVLCACSGVAVAGVRATASRVPTATRLPAYLHTRFALKRPYTEMLSMTARRVPAGATVSVRCTGRGCPFRSQRQTIRHAGSVGLGARFRGRHLRPGARITVTISDRGASRSYIYLIRSHKVPLARIAGATA